MKLTHYFIIVLALTAHAASGQVENSNVIAANGGSGTVNGIKANWTVGEAFINECSSNEYVISQGFHQGSLIIITGTKDEEMNFQMMAYPNPFRDRLTVELDGAIVVQGWTLEVYNLDGKSLMKKPVRSALTEINLTGLPAAVYIIRINDETGHSKIFNVTKQ
jgi:hypothetical protein